jgi:hypothetical protein
MFSFLVSFPRAFPRTLAAAVFTLALLGTTPLLVQAQTSGDAGPVVGKVAPGQQAGQIEGTTESALTYTANTIIPMIGVAFLIYVIFALRTGRGWVTAGVCAALCGMVSGAARLIEWHIQQGAGGIH